MIPRPLYNCLDKSCPLPRISAMTRLPRLPVLVIFNLLAMGVAGYNTIVHPFTLADNRHYIFYVFRLLLWRPYVKYVAASISVLFAWACIQALDYAPPKREESSTEWKEKSKEVYRDENSHRKEDGRSISYVIVWLFATALSVISAPLVEPRYFILPWIFWRLGMARTGNKLTEIESKSNRESYTAGVNAAKDHDSLLWMETAWYTIINIAVGYVFLYRGFEWLQEPGAVQRFMW